MKLSRVQLEALSKYFSDLSKILVASAVIGFFIPSREGIITLPIFTVGSLVAVLCLILSLNLLKDARP